jgi:hypothetical protein
MLNINPVMTAEPSFFKANGTTWKYGTLPNEGVCTENLLSWKRLLACKQVII